MLIKLIGFLPMKIGGFRKILKLVLVLGVVDSIGITYVSLNGGFDFCVPTDFTSLCWLPDWNALFHGLPGLQVLHTTQNLSLASTDYVAQKWDKHENSKSKKVGYCHDLL